MLEPFGLSAARLKAQPLVLPLRSAFGLYDDRFRRFNRLTLLLMFALSVAAIAGLTAFAVSAQIAATSGPFITAALLLAGLVFGLAVDFLCVLSTVNLARSASRRTYWDLVRLTNVDPERIVDAQFDLTLAYVWKLLALVTNLRLALALCLTTCWILFWGRFRSLPSDAFALLALVVFILVPYVLEPRWRTRTVAALSVMVTAAVSQPTTALLAAMSLVLLIWSLPLLGLWLILQLSYWAFPFGLCLSPLAYLVGLYVLYRVYNWTIDRCLSVAARRIIRADSPV